MDIVLSIGLNVGDSEPPRQLSDTLRWISITPRGARVLNLALAMDEWEGVPERSLQVRVNLPPSQSGYPLRVLAQVLSQECIAVLYPGADRWELHYADGSVEEGGTIEEYPVIV